MALHSEFSPSRLVRIINCPGSVQTCASIEEEEKQSSYAAEGSMLHEVIEAVINITPSNAMATEVRANVKSINHKLDLDQIVAIEDCFEYVEKLRGEMLLQAPATEILEYNESRVSLEHFDIPDVWGTKDFSIESSRILHVVDWKFGKGIPVYAEQNDQGFAYVLGTIETPERLKQFDEIYFHIVQPRTNNYSKVLISKAELLEWLKRLQGALDAAKQKYPPFCAGEKQCQWCPAKSYTINDKVFQCEARMTLVNELATEAFSIQAKLPDEVSRQEIADFLERAPMLDAAIKAIAVFALNECLAGREIPGRKAVTGRAYRKWVNPAAVESYMIKHDFDPENFYESKLLSPAKAEKLVGKPLAKEDEFKGLIFVPEGKPTLVAESDKREAIMSKTAEAAFKDYTT